MSKAEKYFLIGTPILLAIRFLSTDWSMDVVREIGIGIVTGVYLTYLFILMKGK